MKPVLNNPIKFPLKPELKVGDTVWRYNSNRRKYGEDREINNYPEFWVPCLITGETSRSWIINDGVYKLPKKNPRVSYVKGYSSVFIPTQEELEFAIDAMVTGNRECYMIRDFGTLPREMYI